MYIRIKVEGGVEVSRRVVQVQIYVVGMFLGRYTIVQCHSNVNSSPEVLCLALISWHEASYHFSCKGKGLGEIGKPRYYYCNKYCMWEKKCNILRELPMGSQLTIGKSWFKLPVPFYGFCVDVPVDAIPQRELFKREV